MDVLANRISSSVYISLTDHINFSLERYKTGIVFDNPLASEVKSFYPGEYLVGEYAVSVIERKLGIKLPSDEAASIAMHFVNAEYNNAMSETMYITRLIRQVIEIVEQELGVKIDEFDINMARFVSHVKFFAFCVFRGGSEIPQNDEYNNTVIRLYPAAYSLVEKIAIFMEKEYNYSMKVDEKVSMAIHVQRICKIEGGQ
jgi:beta-glucoside operon transcriptional antiterminator